MSTRASVVIFDNYSHEVRDLLFAYRHHDGYPNWTCPQEFPARIVDGPIPDDLNLLASWIKQGRIRNNLFQMSGWLYVIGHYAHIVNGKGASYLSRDEPPANWKAGDYEPATNIMGDSSYVYFFDASTGKWSVVNAVSELESKGARYDDNDDIHITTEYRDINDFLNGWEWISEQIKATREQ